MNKSKYDSLVDYLACEMGCEYESNLHYLDAVDKCRLYRIIESVQAEDYSLNDWNDARAYITAGREKGDSAVQVRADLLRELSNPIKSKQH